MNNLRLSFPLQMALAVFLGIFIGLLFGERLRVLGPWSDAYIMILKITAIPYLIVAIMHGVGLLNRAQGLQIVKKGSIFIALALTINISMIYLIRWAFPESHGHATGFVMKDIPVLNFAEMLIPDNVFYDLANNVVPAIVVFSLLFGIALMYIGDKQVAMGGLQTLVDALTRITSWISRITPIGTFIIMAYQAGTIQFSTIKQISTYIILYVIGTCLIIFWIAPRLVSGLTTMKAYQWVKNLIPVLVLAFTTNLVIVALPYIINIIQREIQMLFPKDDNIQNQVQGTVSIIFNLPLGSIYITVFVFFVARFYAVHLVFPAQVQLFFTTFLISLGAVGLGAWINNLTFILDSLALPLDAINLYLTALPFTAGFQSCVSASLISALSFLIILAGRGLLNFTWKKVIYYICTTFIPVILIFGFLKYYTPLPKIKNDAKTIYDLEIESDASVRHFTKPEFQQMALIPSTEKVLDRIIKTKKLRVGYDVHTSPFCFFNKHHKLVGFDVSHAYQLAFDLGCEHIEFIPINYGNLGQQLNEGVFDIAMSAITISSEKLKQMTFPAPILEAKIVFVTKDKNRKKMSTLEQVTANRSLKIAALINSAYEGIAYQEFPSHEIILLESYEDFNQEQPPADILIWEEQEAIAWTVSHPQFHVVYPKPDLGKETLGYPIKMGDHEFLCYMNSWLKLKENDGFKQQQYNLWILGQTHEAAPPEPRWSILDYFLRKAKREN